MGHVSDFNGLNNCEEIDMSRTSDLLSGDNILDFNLADSLLPFSDDTYQQSSLYTSSLSLMQNDDDRNDYFDEPMFDLLFDSDPHFNIDFDVSDSLARERAQSLETDPSKSLAVNGYARKEQPATSCPEQHAKDTLCINSASLEEVNVDNCSSKTDQCASSDTKTYTAEANFKSPESPIENSPIPKIVIKLKPESKVLEQGSFEQKVAKPKLVESESFAHELSLADSCAPMTIADNVKLGRRRSVNVRNEETLNEKKSDAAPHKKKRHSKKESKSHKSKRSSDIRKKHKLKATEGTDVFNHLLSTDDYSAHHLSSQALNLKKEPKLHIKCELISEDDQEYEYSLNKVLQRDQNVKQELHSNDGGEDLSSVEVEVDVEGDSSAVDSYDFAENGISSASPTTEDPVTEFHDSVDNILEDLEIALGDGGNIPELPKAFLDVPFVSEMGETKADCSSGEGSKMNQDCKKDKAVDTKLSASELIDELHAHNQQVFEEIEVSTPDLELELGETKDSIQVVNTGTSQTEQNCANGVFSQNSTSKSVKTEPTSQSNLSGDKKLFNNCSSNPKPPMPELPTETSFRQRKISNSSTGFPSKLTSHRSYRKRRSRLRSSSSSSSSSDTEKFYNRPVKYDPVTDSYIDEFGREVRPTELKRYLKPKSNHQDSHSNNGSSSSTYSRSRSPSSRSHHRKHRHHSRSRSHRKRHYSSSRSRSRSRDQKRKDSNRQHSSKPHGKKPHYMDLEENVRANEERRVMYVGDIPPGFTVEQLKERFSLFGPIQDATIKSKVTSDNSLYIFGFVTFKNRMDACNAIENGNNNPKWPKFELNFGGRRRFCNGNYTDLDGKVAEYESGWYSHMPSYRRSPVQEEEIDDFAELLRLEQRRLGMTK